MARKSGPGKDRDREVRKLLKYYACPTPFHAVRTHMLGSIASPTIETRPMKVVEALWGGDMPEFESLEDLNALIEELVNGLWNRLTLHQKRKHPFRLTIMSPPATSADLNRYAKTRAEEIEAFVDGLFGENEELELPESASTALTHLSEAQSFFRGFVQFSDEFPSAEKRQETVRNLQQLTSICAREINTVVLACTRARRAKLETIQVSPPTWH